VDQLLAGAIGVVIGAVVTVVGTWWISVRLDRQRDHRLLIGAIAVVSAELEENHGRVTQWKGPLDKELGSRLTLDDWSKNKAALAALELRDQKLWQDLLAMYGKIYESRDLGKPPTADELHRLRERVTNEQQRLRNEIRQFTSWHRSSRSPQDRRAAGR
jgi:hypothetical protein